MDDSSNKDEGAEIVALPFKIITGGGCQHEGIADVRDLPPADAALLAQLDMQTATILRDIGKVEVALMGLAQQKVEIYQRWQQANAQLVKAATEAARRVGIDPADTSKAWNLDIGTRQFRRTK